MKIHKINPWNFLEVSSRGAASESVTATSGGSLRGAVRVIDVDQDSRRTAGTWKY
jgi:hypothetical protein